MDCKQCINKCFAGAKCKNFAEGKANSCSNFLTLASFHQHLVEATCPEHQDEVFAALNRQQQEIKETGHTQNVDPVLKEIAKNWKFR